jgi:hypothetical protein
MSAPLLVARRLETRALVANAVRLAFFERYGEPPNPDDRLWELDPLERLGLVGDVELKLGVAFRDEDIEFLVTPDDLVERGVTILIGGER